MNPHIRMGMILFFLSGAGMVDALKLAPDPLAGPPIQLKTPQEAIEILQNSTNRIEMAKAGIWLCKNNAQGAADQLLPFLQDPKFLNRLDFYHGRVANTNLLVNRVVKEIGKLSTSKAEEVILKLINDQEYVEEIGRVDGLIYACGWLGPSSDKILPFLESKVGDFNSLVIAALARIGTPESCAFLKKQILSRPSYDTPERKEWFIPERQEWFESYLLPVRNKPAVIMLYKDVLYSNIQDAGLRNTVVQTLFDYRPDDWFPQLGIEFGPHPPQWSETSPEVLRQVMEIANMALKMDITPETREGVLKAQKEIQGILENKLKSKGN